jgi:hypothetical protein
LVVLVVLFLFMDQYGYAYLTSCRGEERAVFEEFPQYSPRTPRELDPTPEDPDVLAAYGSACVVGYYTPDLPSEILGYFEGRLEEKGWEVRPLNDAALYARRGDYEYRVYFTDDPTRTPQGDMRLTVVVREP